MALMLDKELREEVHSAKKSILTGLDDADLDKSIRGCAIDLHVGAVFRPGKKDGEPGSATTPCTLSVILKEGETAVVRTKESFQLDARHAALVFPVSSVSMQGLLMTNPGHVDPGYVGPVHVTVINMGREPFALQAGARILRGLVYHLSDAVASPFVATSASPITEELLGKLSSDFLSVNDRTRDAAKREIDAAVKRNERAQFLWPALATLIGVIVSSSLTTCGTIYRYDDRIQTLEKMNAVERLQKLEQDYPNDKRLSDLESQMKSLSQAPSASKASAVKPR